MVIKLAMSDVEYAVDAQNAIAKVTQCSFTAICFFVVVVVVGVE